MNALLPGAEPWSHHGTSANGALVLHGFTSNPHSMRGMAEALAAAGYHVELPLLPGHGTVIDDLVPTRWADWADAADAAYRVVAARAQKVIVVGLSLGGALALRVGADHPEVAGLVCINPAARPQPPAVVEAAQQMIASGVVLIPGIGSDIAEPGVTELSYPESALPSMLSIAVDGVANLFPEYPRMRQPLLLINSRQDHVIEPAESDFLASTYGGPVERLMLERSYHVATQDYDKDLIVEATVAFAGRVCG
ncbi:MAG: alpha/beta fold hydrolase [Actinomycetota bacterium]